MPPTASTRARMRSYRLRFGTCSGAFRVVCRMLRDFGLHGMAVLGSAHAQPLLDRRIEIPNRDAAHGVVGLACLHRRTLRCDSVEFNADVDGIDLQCEGSRAPECDKDVITLQIILRSCRSELLIGRTCSTSREPPPVTRGGSQRHMMPQPEWIAFCNVLTGLMRWPNVSAATAPPPWIPSCRSKLALQ